MINPGLCSSGSCKHFVKSSFNSGITRRPACEKGRAYFTHSIPLEYFHVFIDLCFSGYKATQIYHYMQHIPGNMHIIYNVLCVRTLVIFPGGYLWNHKSILSLFNHFRTLIWRGELKSFQWKRETSISFFHIHPSQSKTDTDTSKRYHEFVIGQISF